MATEDQLNALEFARFDRVVRQYAAQSSRTLREVIDRTALNVAMESLDQTKRAIAEDIRRRGTAADPHRVQWYKFIAWLIKNRGVTFVRNKFKTVTTRNGKKKRVKVGETSKVIHGTYTVEQARAVSAKVKANKLRAIGYVAAGFIPAVSFFWNRTKDKPFRRSFKGAKQHGKPLGYGAATGSLWNPEALIRNASNASAEVAGPAVRRAMRKVGVDMLRYMREKMEKAVKQAGGRTRGV